MQGAGEVVVLWAHPVPTATLLSLLDVGERARAERLRDEGEQQRFVTGHALLRLALATADEDPGDIGPIVARCNRCGGAHGKPTITGGPHFSLTHAGNRVAVAVTELGPVGVDVEPLSTGSLADLDPIALSTAEQAVVAALPVAARHGARLRYWVRKEAVLKCTGDGLMRDPSGVEVTGPDEPARLHGDLGDHIVLSDLPFGPDHLGAIAVSVPTPRHRTAPKPTGPPAAPRISMRNADRLLSDWAASAVHARTTTR